MTILLDGYTLPERGAVELNIQRSFEIKVTAEEARRKVNRWLLTEVSCMMGADFPTLVIGERVVWRVPAHFSTPQTGIVGIVGMIDIDVQTGKMENTTACKAAIEERAQALASRLPPYQPLSAIAEKYIPKHLPSAPRLELPDDEPQSVALATVG